MLSTEQVDTDDYVARVTSSAVPGASESLGRHGGRFVGSESWQDERGHWLEIRSTLDDLPGIEVRYARIILPASGPEYAAELEATIYSSGFEERVHTRARDTEPVDGVITL